MRWQKKLKLSKKRGICDEPETPQAKKRRGDPIKRTANRFYQGRKQKSSQQKQKVSFLKQGLFYVSLSFEMFFFYLYFFF